MSDLTPTQYERLQRVYKSACALPARERTAFIESELADDEVLRSACLAMDDESEVPTAFLDPIAPDIASEFRDEKSSLTDPAQIGPVVGRYRLLSLLGEGGFGVVYEAEQTEPVRRRVAVKIIKPGQDSRAVVSRFEAERQALAMMDHPCIAQILDGGVTGPESGHQGLPFFAMELVRGDPITVFCDRERLTIAQRLELMCKVCDAVEHAHKRGIIHRDIKPSNILVSFRDGEITPKVIDFGIAKAIGAGLSEHTLFTMRGQLMGTPAYMSPEQAEMSGVEIDERSDVYSLGVLLYEVLTSRPPFDPRSLQSAGREEMVRIIREVEPQRPSTRLSTQGLSEEGADSAVLIARARRAELHALTRQLRTDLDWVVMRCLEKERDRRYESAEHLGDELHRILKNEPVLAGPPQLRYRVRKFSKRHKVALIWAIAALFIVGVSTSLLVGFSIRNNQLLADNERLMEQLENAQTGALGISSKIFGSSRSIGDFSGGTKGVAFLSENQRSEDRDLNGLLEALRAERKLTADEARNGYEVIARQIDRLVNFETPQSNALKYKLAETLLTFADIVTGLRRAGFGSDSRARPAYQRVLSILSTMSPTESKATRMIARARAGLGDTLRDTDIVKAEDAYREALDQYNQMLSNAGDDTELFDQIVNQLVAQQRNLAVVLARQCRFREASLFLTQSTATRRELAQQQHQYLIRQLVTERGVGVALTTQAELEMEAQAFDLAEIAAAEAFALRQSLRDQAIRGREQILDEFEQLNALGRETDESPADERDKWLSTFRRDVAVSRMILGETISKQGRHDEARTMFEASYEELRRLEREQYYDARMTESVLACALMAASNEVDASEALLALEWSNKCGEYLAHYEAHPGRKSDEVLSKREAEWLLVDGRALALADRSESRGQLAEAVRRYRQLSASDTAQSAYAQQFVRSVIAYGRWVENAGFSEIDAWYFDDLEHAVVLLDGWGGSTSLCGLSDAERDDLLSIHRQMTDSGRP